MDCSHYDAWRCRSCTLLELPYGDQVARKQAECRSLLPTVPDAAWLPAVRSAESGFRNKAKMVVSGTVEQPTLGILSPHGDGVDLRDCGLHTPGLQAALPVLAAFVSRAAVAPYSVAERRGELKHLLVTESPDGELMARLVLRSQEPLSRIRKHLPWLLATLPSVVVVSVNLQPEHKAVLEGEREIVLHGSTLRMRVNDVELDLRPQSFFQTNTAIAAALYSEARAWVGDLDPGSVWDLYCGVGGFALHLARVGRSVVGVEAGAEAVASASTSAGSAPDVSFLVGDATAWALAQPSAPDLVVVNPPRRGIGTDLAAWLESSTASHVLYSSCNAVTLARDLAVMPSLSPVRARLLDMFPQSTHYEVLVLLAR